MTKLKFLVAVLPLFATLGCSDSSERSSAPVDVPSSASLSDLRVVLDRADKVERAISTQRANFHDQTVAVVSKAQADLAANMDNSSYTGSGVEARLIQENYIKELTIAGLNAEKSLLEAYLPLGRAVLKEKKLLVANDVLPTDEHQEVLNISDEISKFERYREGHESVSFPTLSEVSSRFSSKSADVQAGDSERLAETEPPVTGEASSEEADESEVVE